MPVKWHVLWGAKGWEVRDTLYGMVRDFKYLNSTGEVVDTVVHMSKSEALSAKAKQCYPVLWGLLKRKKQEEDNADA